MSDLNQELDFVWVKHSMVMATKRIILTDGEVDIFVFFHIHFRVNWVIFPGMMSCLPGHVYTEMKHIQSFI